MVKWTDMKIEPFVSYCQEYYRRWQDQPSVRDIFYYFVDKFWPNTKSVYKALSRWLVKMRIEGKIDWRLIRDGGGRERSVGDWGYVEPELYIRYQLRKFEESPKQYHLPKWLNQDKVVVVVTEKEADYPPLRAICDSLCVAVQYTRGYGGWRDWFEIAELLKSEEYIDKEIIIIAVGDFDPTGEDIVRFCKHALKTLGLELSLEKAMVTKEQIEEHKLPHKPEDAKEIEKLKRDSRFRKWPYGLYRVETAAFRAKAPQAFRKTMVDAIAKHFDPDIYEDVKELEKQKQNEVTEKIGDMFKRLSP